MDPLPNLNQIPKIFANIAKDASCWAWIPTRHKNWYGAVQVKNKTIGSHRVLYALYKGQIKPSMVIDHLCNNKWCVNPDHLEEVTLAENNRRVLRKSPGGIAKIMSQKTICLRGHEFNKTNTYYRKDRNGRECKICHKIRIFKNQQQKARIAS